MCYPDLFPNKKSALLKIEAQRYSGNLIKFKKVSFLLVLLMIALETHIKAHSQVLWGPFLSSVKIIQSNLFPPFFELSS